MKLNNFLIYCAPVIIILTLYITLYYLTVNRKILMSFMGKGPWNGSVIYDIDVPYIDALFTPIHNIDRYMRPNYWKFDTDIRKNEMYIYWLDSDPASGTPALNIRDE